MTMNGHDLEKALRSKEFKALKQFTMRCSILLANIEQNREEGLHPYEDLNADLNAFDVAIDALDLDGLKEVFYID